MTIHDLADVASLVNAQGRPRPGQRPFQVLREAARLGVKLEVRKGAIGATSPGGLPGDLKAQLIDVWIPVVTMLLDPRRTARLAWEAALAEVSAWWAACARTVEPPWIDDERLTGAVGEAIKATVDHPSLVTAIEAIETWGRAWVRSLAEEGSSPEWRRVAPDGQPWPESAFWRCAGCQQTFAPDEYLPNSGQLCRVCMRAEAGRESLFELPSPPAVPPVPRGPRKKRQRKPESDTERSRCPKCRRTRDREAMLWVGSGAEAARWCMGCALKLEEGPGGPVTTAYATTGKDVRNG